MRELHRVSISFVTKHSLWKVLSVRVALKTKNGFVFEILKKQLSRWAISIHIVLGVIDKYFSFIVGILA